MKLVKHKNCTDVCFRRIHRQFAGDKSEFWTGFWVTIGTTALWQTVHDSFFVRADQVPEWEDYTPPKNMEVR